MSDFFERLESNDKQTVEKAINSIREQFTKVNESWLLNGLFEYYLSTSSERAMEILVNIKEPHHNYLFDRLSESIKVPKMETKVQALTLFGYVARRQPTWLYKLQEHCLLRDLLKLLKPSITQHHPASATNTRPTVPLKSLPINVPHPIENIRVVQTRYGEAIAVKLVEASVFLPRWVNSALKEQLPIFDAKKYLLIRLGAVGSTEVAFKLIEA